MTDFCIDVDIINKLLGTFYDVVKIDFDKDCVTRLKNDSIFTVSNSSSIENFYRYFIETMAAEEDADKIRKCLDPELIRNSKSKFPITEFRIKKLEGKYLWCSCEPLKIKENQWLLIFRLIDKFKCREINADEQRKGAELLNAEKYKIIIDQTDIIVFEWNASDSNVCISSNVSKRLDFEYKEKFSIEDIAKSDIIYPEDRKAFEQYIINIMNADTTTLFVRLRLKNIDGSYSWYRISSNNIFSSDGKLIKNIGTIRDINDVKESFEKLKVSAEADILTGIPNAHKFVADVKKTLSNRNEKKYAVIVFDVHKFKAYNELYGFNYANNILRYIANMMRSILVNGELYARFIGDYFGILTEYNNDQDIIGLIKNLNDKLKYWKGISINISYGIYKVDDNFDNVRIICDYANMAKKTVKGNTIKYYAFYDESMRKKLICDKNIENEMYTALDTGQFVMFLQPKYDIKTSKIIGAEALVRWQHPYKGLLTPDKFLPLFEKNGFIVKLDEYMWERVCCSIRKWLDNGKPPIPVSVNVSRLHIGNPHLVETLDRMTERYNIPKKLLELEITETIFYDNQEELLKKLNKLKSAGYKLLMDDFGSGYSSLNMLKNVPFDVLKIDRNFLNETLITDRGKKIILHTITMSNDIGLNIVAEGVETQEQADYLLSCGCCVAQGYYYSKPIRLNDFEHLACL